LLPPVLFPLLPLPSLFVPTNLLQWDTCGQERFSAITTNFIRGSKVFVLVYDITNLASFEKLDFWFRTAAQIEPEAKFVLVGNKSDLGEDRVVPTQSGM
jgi:GTPase SAR1 family protein